MNHVLLAKIASKYPKLLTLGDLLGKKANQLTGEDLSRVADAVGIKVAVGPELQNAAVALLKGKDIHEVADLIQKPESFEEIFAFLKKGYRGLTELHESRNLELIESSGGARTAMSFLD